MNQRADTDARLRGLIDILEDCRQFYLDVIPGSTGRMRWLHETKAQCYEAMLAEIRHWCAGQLAPVEGGAAGSGIPARIVGWRAAGDGDGVTPRDDFAALLQRVNRLHQHLFDATRASVSEGMDASLERAGISTDVALGSVSARGRGARCAAARR